MMDEKVDQTVKTATLKAVMDATDAHKELILTHINRGIFSTAMLLLPYDREIELDDNLKEKLKFTSLRRNMRNHVYSLDLNELWLHLSRDEIESFFREVFDQTKQARVLIGDRQISYISRSLFL
ncbi:Uncharacterised protein [uncultured archaeon]|nr:Uncharacterised protein [uncultured archaeon]